MKREKQLKLCKICKQQKFDPEQGIVCRITGRQAEFETTCDSFDEDPALGGHQNDTAWNELDGMEADKGKRFLNYLLDTIFLYAFILLFATLLGIVLAFVSPESLQYFEESNKAFEILLGGIILITYYSLFEGLTGGRTPGKYITGTKVVTINGEKPGFGTILNRSVCRCIPFDALSFLCGETGWHDSLSGTMVVDVKRSSAKR